MKLTPAQEKAIRILREHGPMTEPQKRSAGIACGTTVALMKRGLVEHFTKEDAEGYVRHMWKVA